MTETWRPIPGFPRYEVSDLGNVRSLIGKTPRLLTLKPGMHGYVEVKLYPFKGAHGETVRVHRLVLLAFVGPRPADQPHIRHRDGRRTNNRLDNLSYGTVSQNSLDSVQHGSHANARKTHCLRGHELAPENIYTPPSRPTARRCRECVRIHLDAHRERVAAAAQAA